MPETARAKLKITDEEARYIADLLRYVVSLNTTAGLVSPTQRRLATSTYKAVELAAFVLEGKTFEEALEESSKAWTGSLEEDHRRALKLLDKQRDALKEAMSGRLTPEQAAQYLEVSQDQFLELVRPNFARKGAAERPNS
jgi:predicted RNase H-like HicB family nuclease